MGEGDFCPICSLPIPFPMGDHSVVHTCCMKMICDGCALAADTRGLHNCPCCRAPTPLAHNGAVVLAMIQAKAEKKNPEAIDFLGNKRHRRRLLLSHRRLLRLSSPVALRATVAFSRHSSSAPANVSAALFRICDSKVHDLSVSSSPNVQPAVTHAGKSSTKPTETRQLPEGWRTWRVAATIHSSPVQAFRLGIHCLFQSWTVAMQHQIAEATPELASR